MADVTDSFSFRQVPAIHERSSAISALMTYDPREKLDHVGTDPNKGLNTRTYMIALIAAILVLLGLAVLFVGKATKATPGKDPSPPSSSPAAKTPGH